jgi:hypothetical protein
MKKTQNMDDEKLREMRSKLYEMYRVAFSRRAAERYHQFFSSSLKAGLM